MRFAFAFGWLSLLALGWPLAVLICWLLWATGNALGYPLLWKGIGVWEREGMRRPVSDLYRAATGIGAILSAFMELAASLVLLLVLPPQPYFLSILIPAGWGINLLAGVHSIRLSHRALLKMEA